jgi:hypothetical protein
MKLVNVYMAKDAMTNLGKMKMTPGLGYKVLKYLRLFDAEFAIIEKQRVAAVHAATGTKEGEEVRIEPDTLPFTEFWRIFSDSLDVDSELAPMAMKLDELIAALDAEKGNVLSATDLAVLEPFFAA